MNIKNKVSGAQREISDLQWNLLPSKSEWEIVPDGSTNSTTDDNSKRFIPQEVIETNAKKLQAAGKSNEEIATILGITVEEVEKYLTPVELTEEEKQESFKKKAIELFDGGMKFGEVAKALSVEGEEPVDWRAIQKIIKDRDAVKE